MSNVQKVQEEIVSLKEIIDGAKKIENGSLIVFDKVKTKEILVEVNDKYKSFVVSKDNIDEAKKIREEIRSFRYGIQKIEDHNKGILNKAKTKYQEDSKELIGCISESENNVHNQIKEIEDEKKRLKEEKERKEAERISAINKAISEKRSSLEVKYQVGKTESDLNEFDDVLKSIYENLEFYEEFQFEAEDIIEEFTKKREVIVNRINEEKQLKLDQEKLEKEKREQEEKDAELKRKQEEFEKEKAEFEQKKKEEEEKTQQREKQLRTANRINILESKGYVEVNGSYVLNSEKIESKFTFIEKTLMESNDDDFNSLIELQIKSIEENEKRHEEAIILRQKIEEEESERVALEQNISENSKPKYNDLSNGIKKVIDGITFEDLKNSDVNKAFSEFQIEVGISLQKLQQKLFIKE